MIELSPHFYTAVAMIISAGISSVITYLGTRRKTVTEAFASILEANERFRQEIRNDLSAAREESEHLRINLQHATTQYTDAIAEISQLKRIILDYQRDISNLNSKLIEYQKEIQILKSVISDYRIEIEKLRKTISEMK